MPLTLNLISRGIRPRAADGDEEEAADGVGRRIPSVPIPHHTHILLARARAPYSPPRPSHRNGTFASRSGVQRNLLESWSSKLSTPRSHRHRFCLAIARFSIQAGPWIITT